MESEKLHRILIKKDAERATRERKVTIKPVVRKLEIAGHEISVQVMPRVVATSTGKKSESRPRMASVIPLTAVEKMVGKDAIVHQNALSYSQRESDQDVVESVIKGSSEIGLIAGTMPEMEKGISDQLTILASFNLNMDQLNISNPIYLIGKPQTIVESGK